MFWNTPNDVIKHCACKQAYLISDHYLLNLQGPGKAGQVLDLMADSQKVYAETTKTLRKATKENILSARHGYKDTLYRHDNE